MLSELFTELGLSARLLSATGASSIFSLGTTGWLVIQVGAGSRPITIFM